MGVSAVVLLVRVVVRVLGVGTPLGEREGGLMFICAPGEPGTGKSVWMSRAIPIIAGKMRSGGIILDPVGSRAYQSFRTVKNAKEALYAALSLRAVVVYRKPSVSEVDSICGYLINQGDRYPRQEQIPGVVLGADELRWYVAARHSQSAQLVLLARGHRNVNCALVGATQSYSDLPRDLTCSVTQYRIYRCSAPRDLRRMREDLAIDPNRIRTLSKPPEGSGPREGQFIVYP